MRRRKRQPQIVGHRLVYRDGAFVTVTVYEDAPVRSAPQPMRCKTKRTAKVCDPDISQRPRVVQPARRK